MFCETYRQTVNCAITYPVGTLICGSPSPLKGNRRQAVFSGTCKQITREDTSLSPHTVDGKHKDKTLRHPPLIVA